MKKNPVIICRCEEITEEEILQAIKNGARSINSIKRMTRAGMGLCQGHNCAELVQEILVRELHYKVSELPGETKRIPVEPVKLGVLEGGDNAD
ncbi:MAG: (2Fe-2S)-binding protein [Candidatus Omnitrophota bacterium]